ncbi:MAG: ATP-binding cassette domain-containing protein [Gammaproteobacteria bacterium]|nr:ATP-binding cassette domain-containing protein [Gammaproteobacteria bacterium]
MNLVAFDKVCLEFGDQPLLVDAGFTMEAGERVCLIGRNGAGKSSMLKLIAGDLQPDRGEIRRPPDIVVSRLEQALPAEQDLTVTEVVAGGLSGLKEWIDAYERKSAEASTERETRFLARLENRIEAKGGWNIEQRVNAVMTEMGLTGDRRLAELSGGWRRRVSLARALVNNPDLLLLDEPTNHLDLASIRWLEDRVRGFGGSVLFITHDRAFLQRLATRIVELDRGRITSWPGDYRAYLARKEQALQAEADQHREFDRKLAREETWIRQGLKARRKRNEGRVRALQTMREERSKRIAPQAGPRIHVEEAERSGRKVIEARNISHRYGNEALIDQLSLRIMRGDRVGLIGNNGVGKTTLLRILLGEIAPQEGTVKLGTGLEIGYFDQLRRELDPEKTVAEVVGDGRDYVDINGKQRHIIGYLKGFLFSPKRIRSPVKSLSGGETNRIILAKLFTRPSNLLVLDEPTNDLDVETLEILEARLAEYPGTLIVVSHDRQFLDNVVTSVLVFEPGGRIREYIGSYSDWERRQRPLRERDRPASEVRARGDGAGTGKARKPAAKLSYKHKLELEQLPDRIETLEHEVARLQEQAGDPDLYNRPHGEYSELLKTLREKEVELSRAVERWAELEELQQILQKS